MKIDVAHKLMHNYFVENPVFCENYFHRRVWMYTDLFKHIVECVKLHDPFFEHRWSCTEVLGHNTYQKVTATLRMLAYCISVDLVYDHLAICESQAIMCVNPFAVAMVEVFRLEYLRAPNAQDMARLLEHNATCGFPGLH
jgi:hypothetical protein